MKILRRYTVSEFLRFFLLNSVALIFLYFAVDFFENFDEFLKSRVSASIIVEYYFYKIPLIFIQISPLSSLLSVVLTIGLMARSNEMIAIKAAGINPSKIITPLLLTVFLISILNFLINESVVPYTSEKAETIRITKIEKKPLKGTYKSYSLWYLGEKSIYHIRFIDFERNILKGITIFKFDDNFSLYERIDANEALWNGNGWKFTNGVIIKFADGDIKSIFFKEKNIPIPENPEDFKLTRKKPDELNFFEMREYLRRLEREGYEVRKLKVDLYSKTSIPFSSFIMTLIGITFSLRVRRKGGVAKAISLAVLLSVCYFTVFSFAVSLGKAGVLSPLVSSWLPNIIFAAAGVLSLKWVEY